MRKLNNGYLAAIIILVVIIADQILKIWVKTSFFLYESLDITSWFKLNFVENPGMAFGIELGSKMFLTIFRIVASAVLIYIIYKIRNNKLYSRGFIVCLALITAGAIGNVIDCMFYGLIFNESTPYTMATLFPEGGGYASFLHGKVVDMFYFPIIDTTFPEWLPVIGGDPFRFFAPVFNFADSCVTCGALYLIAFQYRFFMAEDNAPKRS